MNAHASTARAEKTQPVHIGDHLREWRQRRHLSQLDLAGDAEISARHLSFVETGRAAPSRDMVLKLAERLEVPLRERNVLLVAAGYAPAFPQRSLDDPALKSARAAIDLVLRAHEPNPALAYDRHWNLVSANRMVAPLLEGIPQRLLGQPLNILRLAFHPEALAPRTVNLAEWSSHLLERLHRQCEASADPELYLHHHDLRHPGRHHAVGTGAGDVLSGRRTDRRADAKHGGRFEVGVAAAFSATPALHHNPGGYVARGMRPAHLFRRPIGLFCEGIFAARTPP
jgi:transcriptional regulator with XRE-family HTH domain